MKATSASNSATFNFSSIAFSRVDDLEDLDVLDSFDDLDLDELSFSQLCILCLETSSSNHISSP